MVTMYTATWAKMCLPFELCTLQSEPPAGQSAPSEGQVPCVAPLTVLTGHAQFRGAPHSLGSGTLGAFGEPSWGEGGVA